MSSNKLVRGGLVALILAAIGGTAVGVGAFRHDDEVVSLSEVPAKVRRTIEQYAKRGTIDKIERSTEDGRTVYEVEGRGQDFEFIVGQDGSFLGMDHEDDQADEDHDGDEGGEADEGDQPERAVEITFADVPRAVRDTFEDRTGDAKPTRVERIADEDVTKYEIEYALHGATASMTLSDHGEMIEMETPVDFRRLPAAVRAEILKDYPGATIEAAEAVQLFYYELDVVVDGKRFEVGAFATGDIEDRLVPQPEDDEQGHADEDHEDENHEGGD